MGFFDSKQKSKTTPWGPAAQYLEGMLPTIAGLQTPEYYGGDLTAGLAPGMQQALAGMYGFGAPGGPGGASASALMGAGTPLLGGYGQAQEHLNRMANTATPQFQFGQGTYDQIMGNLAPGVQNLFDVNARNAQQQFDFNTLPGLNMAAAQAGGYGGTKALQQSALGQAMTAGNIQNMGANLWQNAANQATQGGMTAGLQNLGQQNLQDQRLLSGYMGLGGAGANLLNLGYNQGANNLRLGFGAGQWENQYDQGAIDRNIQRHQFNQMAPWQAEQSRLGMFMSPAQAFSTTTQTQSPSGFSNLMTGLGTLGTMGMGLGALGGAPGLLGGAGTWGTGIPGFGGVDWTQMGGGGGGWGGWGGNLYGYD